jgi:hypothetical protein
LVHEACWKRGNKEKQHSISIVTSYTTLYDNTILTLPYARFTEDDDLDPSHAQRSAMTSMITAMKPQAQTHTLSSTFLRDAIVSEYDVDY